VLTVLNFMLCCLVKRAFGSSSDVYHHCYLLNCASQEACSAQGVNFVQEITVRLCTVRSFGTLGCMM
jgi:hypothetical protein